MQKIFDFIRLNGTRKSVSAGTLIKSKNNDVISCHLIETGLVVIFTDIHCRPVRTVYGPHVVGLNQLLHPQEELAFKLIHSSVVYSIPAITLTTMVKENNLWPTLAAHLSELVYELSYKNKRYKIEDRAAMVYKILQSLQNESEEVRITHTVNDYVCYLTGLSSSTVSRTLDMFKRKHYIEVHNGLLIRLHEQPELES